MLLRETRDPTTNHRTTTRKRLMEQHKSPQEILLEFQSKMRIDQSTHQEALTAGAFFFLLLLYRGGGGMEREREKEILLLLSLQVTFIYLFFYK